MTEKTPDFRLGGYAAVNDRVAEQFWQQITINDNSLSVLAEHHTGDDQHSYYVLHDRSATWGFPGDPQIVALHLKRDAATRTFRFDRAELPLPAMAQSWLIARGCPEEAILVPEGLGTTPADDPTRALEERLRRDGDHFALLRSYTHDVTQPIQTTVLLRALDERAPVPFRVLLEEADTGNWTHTLREGGFATTRPPRRGGQRTGAATTSRCPPCHRLPARSRRLWPRRAPCRLHHRAGPAAEAAPTPRDFLAIHADGHRRRRNIAPHLRLAKPGILRTLESDPHRQLSGLHYLFLLP